jgi:hypothetical protein
VVGKNLAGRSLTNQAGLRFVLGTGSLVKHQDLATGVIVRWLVQQGRFHKAGAEGIHLKGQIGVPQHNALGAGRRDWWLSHNAGSLFSRSSRWHHKVLTGRWNASYGSRWRTGRLGSLTS